MYFPGVAVHMAFTMCQISVRQRCSSRKQNSAFCRIEPPGSAGRKFGEFFAAFVRVPDACTPVTPLQYAGSSFARDSSLLNNST